MVMIFYIYSNLYSVQNLESYIIFSTDLLSAIGSLDADDSHFGLDSIVDAISERTMDDPLPSFVPPMESIAPNEPSIRHEPPTSCNVANSLQPN